MSTDILPSPRPRASRLRWAVPVAVAAVVVAGFAARPMLASADADGLPPVTSAELLANVAQADPQALSGTVVWTARLGLPDLSMISTQSAASPTDLLDGSTTLKVWTDAAGRSRVSLLGDASEFSVVHDTSQAWTYASADQAVVHYTLSDADAARLQGLAATPTPTDLPTPQQLADDLLAQADETSTVTLDAATQVAGRQAYQLVVTPRSTTTLVGRVSVAVDAQTWTPLRVQVWSRSDATTPTIELGFTDVRFAAPSDEALTFTPPAGASVREVVVPLPVAPSQDAPADTPAGEVHGSGWDSVVELTGVDLTALAGGQAEAMTGMAPQKVQELADQLGADPGSLALDGTDLIGTLTTQVEAGRLMTSTLLSVLITDDGRVLAGAVPPAALTALAG